MKILIAEDEPAFRQLLAEMLVKWGYEVVAARDGNEAWQALKSKDAPQLAILDWMMPGITGVELCRKVRQELQEPYTYLLLLTSQQRDEDLVAGMEAGADDYLTKPVKTSELRVRLNAGRRIIELQNELTAHAAELEVINSDLEAFSYTVANDILKSLLSIGDNANAIKNMICDRQDEQCLSYTRRIYEKTRHLGELIGLMQLFFRPTRSKLQREPLDLSAMAEEAANRLRNKQPMRQVTFRISEGLVAKGDSNFMRVVLESLFDNAWKHTERCAEAVIEFGVAESEGKPAYFVRDNGEGFDMAQAESFFKPFQPRPGAEGFAKTGIGLATVQRIIRRHGGRVWPEGVPGKGATFWFTLGPLGQ